MMEQRDSIYIAGHRGLLGTHLLRLLAEKGFGRVLSRTRDELNLTWQELVDRFFKDTHPDYVVLAAAKVGGIHANIAYPAHFLYDNVMIQSNVIHAACACGVRKLLFFGSACTYPRDAVQPVLEGALLSGSPEPSNEAYAVAKTAGIKMCQSYRRQYGCNFICAMPTNLYGPSDNFDVADSHVIPGLIRKFHEAKSAGARTVTLWGTGKPMREFLHARDAANAALFLMDHYDDEAIVNVGSGSEISIAELASLISDVVGYGGDVIFDRTKPDGAPRKVLDSSKLREMGWKPSVELRDGLEETYRWYIESEGCCSERKK